MQPVNLDKQNKQVIIRKQSPKRVFDWYKAGFNLFKADKFNWISISIAAWVMALLATLIPFIGEIVLSLLLPGVFAIAHHSDREQDFKAELLFAGFKHRLGPLLQLFVINFAFSIICVLITGSITGIDLSALADTQQWLYFMQVAGLVYLPFFVLVVLTAGIIMLYDLKCWPAFKLAIQGGLANLPGLLIFTLVTLFAAMLASIPMFLGLLVFIPILHATIYYLVSDIFYCREQFKVPYEKSAEDSFYV
ncbi:hypothetical protein [Gayadomonas joobiniege]|uniref:hypothetical protein n=1 Tax=Gayadomonas joobiniege TaxID=1234606 RepID=UPI000375D4CC|nr:hypothetical protein [Gayadomonas joobiniege]